MSYWSTASSGLGGGTDVVQPKQAPAACERVAAVRSEQAELQDAGIGSIHDGLFSAEKVRILSRVDIAFELLMCCRIT
jgi:hypothetical protein